MYIYSGSPQCRWQAHKCVGIGLCRCEKFRKFLTSAELEPKRWFFRCPAHSLHTEKSFLQTNGIDGKHIVLRCAFSGSQSTKYQRLQMSEPQTRERFQIPIISLSHPTLKNLLNSMMRLFFKTVQQWGDIARKRLLKPGHFELTLVIRTWVLASQG